MIQLHMQFAARLHPPAAQRAPVALHDTSRGLGASRRGAIQSMHCLQLINDPCCQSSVVSRSVSQSVTPMVICRKIDRGGVVAQHCLGYIVPRVTE
jgi:hypothetical protein